jgi:hypothetical protein
MVVAVFNRTGSKTPDSIPVTEGRKDNWREGQQRKGVCPLQGRGVCPLIPNFLWVAE